MTTRKSSARSSEKRSSSAAGTAARKRGRPAWLLAAVLLLVVLLCIVQEGWPGSESSTPATDRELNLSDDEAVQVVFTTPWLVYPDVPAERTPPPHEQAIIADIDAARSSIDMATFEYNLTSIGDALVRAQRRGVAVRLALDRENLEDADEAFWAGELEQAGIPISWQNTDAFQHSKFIIIDRELVWTGSWNATINDTYRNNNNLLRFTVPDIVDNYAAEFGQMFEGYFGSQKESLAPNPVVVLDTMLIENYFSPQDGVQQHVLERLDDARESIRFMAFSYTSDPIADAMIAGHEAGLEVQGIYEKRNAGGSGSDFGRLEEAGIDVLEDGNCYTMHHKVIIIDDATVITGSYNFTRRAEDTNDENLLIIDSPELSSLFLQEFERIYEQARNPIRCGR